VHLVGLPPNTEASGARIFVTIDTRTQMREISIGGSYIAQNPTTQVFGLGNASAVDELRVEWPPLGANAEQPVDWVRTNVIAGVVGDTLLVCHPELANAPAACMASE
jgi:hypothetical protein